jgi:hypothetical protein
MAAFLPTRAPAAGPSSHDCGIPIDSQYFDDSSIVALPAVGASLTLARIELPAQYCGVLEFFSQFTDLYARDASQVSTPGLTWQIRANGRPLSPYHQVNTILNPWGSGSYQFALRLPEGALLELVARRTALNTTGSDQTLRFIGGRLLGRYWYNSAYGSSQ